jgi:hypothetical protein
MNLARRHDETHDLRSLFDPPLIVIARGLDHTRSCIVPMHYGSKRHASIL